MNNDIPHAATHSSLDLFEKPSILTNFSAGHEIEIFPIASLDGPNLEFSIETDRNVFLDMEHVFLDLTVTIVKGTGPETPLEWHNTDDTHQDKAGFVNNVLHSLFSNCDVSFNNELIYSSNGHYAHKAMVETELSSTKGTKDTLLSCQGYTYETDPGDRDSEAIVQRAAMTRKSENLHLYGRLAADVFRCPNLLVPNTHVRINMVKAPATFALITDDTGPNKNYRIKFRRASLHCRLMTVTEDVHRGISGALSKTPARYMFPEQRTKTFIIPPNQNQFIRENVFNNEPIRRLVLAMNTNEAFSGTLETNPFHYQNFGLREIRISRGGQPLFYTNTTNDVRTYFNTLSSLDFDQDGPSILMSEYPNHYYLVFDMTSTQEANKEVLYPECIGSGIRIELYFKEKLTQSIELLVLGERFSTVLLHKDGRVMKDG
jgi:hypothetical protein